MGNCNFKAHDKSKKFSAAPESTKALTGACLDWESPHLSTPGKCKPDTDLDGSRAPLLRVSQLPEGPWLFPAALGIG